MTGIDYPTIELGGVQYTLRLTREVLLFRLSAHGYSLMDLRGPKSFACAHAMLHAMIQNTYPGTVEDLVQLVGKEDKFKVVDQALGAVIKKVFPLTQAPVAAADSAAPLPN